MLKLKSLTIKLYVLVFSFVLFLDQYTKLYADTVLNFNQERPVFPGFKCLLNYNKGAAFSFLADQSGWQRWFFIALTLCMSLYIIWSIKQLRQHEFGQGLGLSMILGGAIGNLWDRVLHGYVIDFISIYYKTYHWPTFNVADLAISVGAGLYAYQLIFTKDTNLPA